MHDSYMCAVKNSTCKFATQQVEMCVHYMLLAHMRLCLKWPSWVFCTGAIGYYYNTTHKIKGIQTSTNMCILTIFSTMIHHDYISTGKPGETKLFFLHCYGPDTVRYTYMTII